MQEKFTGKQNADRGADRDLVDTEINQRLVDHIKANTTRSVPQIANDNRFRRGFFAQAWSVLGLIGLMIVAFIYTRLVGREA